MRKHKKLIITLIILIFITGGLYFWFGFNNPSMSKNINFDKFYSTWMSNIKDETKLKDVVIPGSHDAGSNGMMPQARTQGHNIKEQLKGGVRYFDIRVKENKDDLVIFHGPITGQKFSKVINEFNNFVIENPSEFIIIDFQHLGDDCHDKIIKMINDTISKDKILDPFFHPDINEITFDVIRKQKVNFMIVWKSSNGVEEKEAELNNFYTRPTALRSEYDGAIHKSSDAQLIKKFDDYYKNYEDDKLFVLQAQRTAKTLLGKPSIYEFKFNDDVNNFVTGLKNDKEKLDKTNIIMRDFVVSDINKVNLILSLNLDKNNVKEDKITIFNIVS